VSAHYEFGHSLYRAFLYGRLSPSPARDCTGVSHSSWKAFIRPTDRNWPPPSPYISNTDENMGAPSITSS